MASKLLRRSGLAVGQVCVDVLRWRPDVIVQVGIGGYHQEVDPLRETWPDVKFIGFEPCPDVNLDDYPGPVHRLAISSSIGKSTFHVSRLHKDGSSLMVPDKDVKSRYSQIEVDVDTLDHLFSSGPVGEHVMLWLDCEGSELSALIGAKKFIEQVEVVNVEYTNNPLSTRGCMLTQVHELLEKYGFKRQWVHSFRISDGMCDGIYVRPNIFKPNHCCDPVDLSDGELLAKLNELSSELWGHEMSGLSTEGAIAAIRKGIEKLRGIVKSYELEKRT